MELQQIAHLRGLSPQFLFAADTLTQPGKIVCHFVRLETVAFDEDKCAGVQIPTITDANDPRLHFLARCMVGGAQPVIQAMLLLNVCGDAMQAAIDQMPGNTDVRMATIDKLQACLDAIQELGETGTTEHEG